MKRIATFLISLIMVTEIALSYTSTIRISDFGGSSTSEPGNEVKIIPKVGIESWEVKKGNVVVTDNKFTMPQEDVEIEGKVTEKYKLRIEFLTIIKIEEITKGKEITVSADNAEGYTFSGWIAEGITLTELQRTSPEITFTMPGNAVTLVANYTASTPAVTTYTVSYDVNGGSNAPASQTKTAGTPLTLSSTLPTKDGFTFIGWNTTQGATVAEYQPGGSFTTDANTTLYAVWELQLPTLASVANVGDYVTYTPSSTSYTVSTSASGYTSAQTFNPSATTSWRVFSIDGDVVKLVSADMVQTSSSADLYLRNLNGYKNAVKTLNDLCGAYVNSTYATSGRSIGSTDPWNETAVDSTKSLGVINTSTYPLTWTNTYKNGNNGFPYTDALYNSDVTILKNNSMLHTNGDTWLASRYLLTDSSGSYFAVRGLSDNGVVFEYGLYQSLSDGSTHFANYAHGVRPVITLKSGIKKASGSGTQASPYIISQ